LSFWEGNRNTNFLANYEVFLRYLDNGSQYDIAVFRNLTAGTGDPAEGGWHQESFGFTAAAGDLWFGKELRVVFSTLPQETEQSNLQVCFDDITLDYPSESVPEPVNFTVKGTVPLDGFAEQDALGGLFGTVIVIVFEYVSFFPSLSVTVRVTVYVPEFS